MLLHCCFTIVLVTVGREVDHIRAQTGIQIVFPGTQMRQYLKWCQKAVLC
jgi:hypothetical protein